MKVAAIAWSFVFWLVAALSVAICDEPRIDVLHRIGLLALFLSPAVTGMCIVTAHREGRLFEREFWKSRAGRLPGNQNQGVQP